MINGVCVFNKHIALLGGRDSGFFIGPQLQFKKQILVGEKLKTNPPNGSDLK